MVGEGGFEPPKSVTTDLQSAPFGRSGTLPYLIACVHTFCIQKLYLLQTLSNTKNLLTHVTAASLLQAGIIKSWWTDSNPRPADYKSAALPTELHQHVCQTCMFPKCLYIITHIPIFVNSFLKIFLKGTENLF